MGLGGGVNWPFLCSLQRVANLLRALARPWVPLAAALSRV